MRYRARGTFPRWDVSERREAAHGALRSRLQLHDARAADAGEYQCHAINPFGRAERALVLSVNGESSPKIKELLILEIVQLYKKKSCISMCTNAVVSWCA